VTEKQEKNKKMSNNEEMKNSFEVEKLRSDYHIVKELNYHVTDLNVNFYDVEDYNQKKENDKSNINFVAVSIIYCHNCHQVFKFRNTLFHHLHFESFKLTHCSNRKIKTISLFTVMLTKSLNELLKIVLTSVVIKDIEIDYDF